VLPLNGAPGESLAWSADDRLVAVGASDGTIQLWQENGLTSHRLIGLLQIACSILFHPNGQWLLAGDRDRTRVWNLASGDAVLAGPLVPWGFTADARGRGSALRRGPALPKRNRWHVS
jgi:hypothetical protein